MEDKREIKTSTRCSKCNSTQTYIRTYTLERVCHKCGFIEKIKIEVKK